MHSDAEFDNTRSQNYGDNVVFINTPNYDQGQYQQLLNTNKYVVSPKNCTL